uniref:Large ribosomal subunit protein bL33c n=1 Tax=Galaxaura rugosa TaxID=268570 RepID=A0A1G4NSX6_9FLOR|nr:Ribosomal protein L33 [Galaxaura rugosa]SCW21760.1 Ribosomal protein L33 [Galaxaura rugosa]
MGKNKGTRITITLECTSNILECTSNNSLQDKSRRNNTFRYTSSKNRRNTPHRLELKKFCQKCNNHAIFKEIK